ncbi:hypothetical protein FRC04_008018 [Tulasnella sp. 424]|nr:hypothetical protein FRC04_008018 [Tulasnella sp. 424]KAG8974874.1 hypothetical protein FRC05_006807 [Tulasnella sp. 425]
MAFSNAHEIDLSKLPDVSDISPETITDRVNAINSLCPNPRLKFVMERLVTHLHQVVAETNLTTEELVTAIQFLTRVGQTCADNRQEFIVLAGVLGVLALVDSINHPGVGGSTENTVLGPFFTEDAADIPHGGSIASDKQAGTPMFVCGRVLDTSGQPVPNAKIETWETDAEGFYDTQHADRQEPDCRGRLRSQEDGSYAFRGIVPVAYPIQGDGPVGDLLKLLGRHNFRPAHLHIMIEAPGFETLVTALYPRDDKYLKSDAVFGVKTSLIVDLQNVTSDEEARARGFKSGPFKLLKQDFVLVKHEEAKAVRAEMATKTVPDEAKVQEV